MSDAATAHHQVPPVPKANVIGGGLRIAQHTNNHPIEPEANHHVGKLISGKDVEMDAKRQAEHDAKALSEQLYDIEALKAEQARGSSGKYNPASFVPLSLNCMISY